MSREIENVLAALDGFRMSDQMDYAAYSSLYDMISVLDVPEWISVKDRLPENSNKVLTYGDPITHWMPLPEPPKEEAQE